MSSKLPLGIRNECSFSQLLLVTLVRRLLRQDATVLTAGKVRCSPSSPCSRADALCAWLRVALLLPSPALRAVAMAAAGWDEKAGSSIEPESWIGNTAICIGAVRSGLSVTAPADAQFRVCRVQRLGLA